MIPKAYGVDSPGKGIAVLTVRRYDAAQRQQVFSRHVAEDAEAVSSHA